MTRLQIRTTIRNMLDDTAGIVSDHFWTDSEINEYIQEAVEEISIRTLCNLDSTTPAYSQITMVANQIDYAFPSGVLRVDAITKSWDGQELTKTTRAEITHSTPLWRSSTQNPYAFLTDYTRDVISIAGKLTAVTTQKLNLTVRRIATTMTADTDIPDIPVKFHRKTYSWILFRCFNKQDSEIYNPQKAEHYRNLFEGAPNENGRGGDIRQMIITLDQFTARLPAARFF